MLWNVWTLLRSGPLVPGYHRWSVVALHAVVATAEIPPPRVAVAATAAVRFSPALPLSPSHTLAAAVLPFPLLSPDRGILDVLHCAFPVGFSPGSCPPRDLMLSGAGLGAAKAAIEHVAGLSMVTTGVRGAVALELAAAACGKAGVPSVAAAVAAAAAAALAAFDGTHLQSEVRRTAGGRVPLELLLDRGPVAGGYAVQKMP